MTQRSPRRVDRRTFLAGSAAATAVVVALPAGPARATPDALREAIRQIVGAATLREGRVKIDIPSLVENGNTVPLVVTVESPMTADDRIVAIHVLNEKNPQPHVFHARLGPGLPKATVSTRIKLNDSQKLVAIARTGKGEFWSASADVIVTLAACVEDLA